MLSPDIFSYNLIGSNKPANIGKLSLENDLLLIFIGQDLTQQKNELTISALM